MIGNKMTLQYKVDKQVLERLDNNIVVEKSLNFLYVKFIFSDEWRGLTKYALFNYIDIDSPYKLEVNKDGIVKVPYDLITFPGFLITLQGVNKDGVRITTETRMVDVQILGTIDADEKAVKYVTSNNNTINIDKNNDELDLGIETQLDYTKDTHTLDLYAITHNEKDDDGEPIEVETLLSSVVIEGFEEVDNTFEITMEDVTIEDGKVVFNSDVAQEIMSMNKRLKVDASIVDPTVEQGAYIGVFTPRGIIDYSLPQTTIIYEYTTTNWLIDTFLTTYVDFRWDATTEKLYVYTNKPTTYERHIVGFNNDGSGGIGLTSNMDSCTSHINTLHINDLETVSVQNQPILEFNANGDDELESIAFKQDGSNADFNYTMPKGAKHYVVNELPTQDIDKNGNYYVMTESEDTRGYLSTDISNLSQSEYPSSNPNVLRQNAVVNSTDFTQLQMAYIGSGNGYMGDFAIKFNIPCAVTVTVNPTQTSMAFMYIDVNGVNVKLVNANTTETYTRNFNVGETLCVRGANFNSSSNMHYKLAIQPFTVDGKIPLSTNVDEYINYENLWFKNGGGSEVHLYEHKLTINAYGNFDCYMHPIYLSTDTAITKDNTPNYLIGYNNYNGESNICCTISGRVEIENHASNLILGITDTVTQIF